MTERVTIPCDKPPTFIIQKERIRLLFNEPREWGCLSLELGGGGLSMFLDDQEMMDLAGQLIGAARRIRKARCA